MSQAVQFTYKVVEAFDSTGNKIPEVLSHNAIFVECSHVQKDIIEVMEGLAMLMKEFNLVFYAIIEQRLNSFVDLMEERRFACNYVPEIDIVLKDQMGIYM